MNERNCFIGIAAGLLAAVLVIGKSDQYSIASRRQVDLGKSFPHGQHDDMLNVEKKNALGSTLIPILNAIKPSAKFQSFRKSMTDEFEKSANFYLMAGRPSEAADRAAACLNVDPERPYCWWFLIDAYSALGDNEQMIAVIEECQRLLPLEFFCIKKARDFYLARGDFQMGDTIITESFSIIENKANREEALSRFYAFTGERKKQLQALDRACALGEKDACE